MLTKKNKKQKKNTLRRCAQGCFCGSTYSSAVLRAPWQGDEQTWLSVFTCAPCVGSWQGRLNFAGVYFGELPVCYLATARARAAESVLDFLRSNSSLSQIPLLNARVRAHTNRGREIKTRCRAWEARADSCVRWISRCAVERLPFRGVALPDFGTNAVPFSLPSRHKQVVK